MDRKDNSFLFSNLKTTQHNPKKAVEKYKEEKQQIIVNKQKEQKAFVIQKYLQGYKSRMNLRKQYQTELTKNLTDLDKLSQLLLMTKNQTFYLPIKNMLVLIRTFNLLNRLRVWPKIMRKKKQNEYFDIIMNLCKWIQRGLEKPENNIISTYFKDPQNQQIGLRNFKDLLK